MARIIGRSLFLEDEDGRLARTIRKSIWGAFDARNDRTHVDDRAASFGQHAWNSSSTNAIHGIHVNGKGALPRGLVAILDCSLMYPASTVKDDVEMVRS